MSEKKRYNVIVIGRVQGVFFRAYTKDEADRLGLTGWVRNRPDRTVEAMIEGISPAVEQMITWFRQGSPMSRVDTIQLTEEKPVGEHSTFEIHYY